VRFLNRALDQKTNIASLAKAVKHSDLPLHLVTPIHRVSGLEHISIVVRSQRL
jgi:hypothetical protein